MQRRSILHLEQRERAVPPVRRTRGATMQLIGGRAVNPGAGSGTMKAPFGSMVERGGCQGCVQRRWLMLPPMAAGEKEEQEKLREGRLDGVASGGGCKEIRGMVADAWILTRWPPLSVPSSSSPLSSLFPGRPSCSFPPCPRLRLSPRLLPVTL